MRGFGPFWSRTRIAAVGAVVALSVLGVCLWWLFGNGMERDSGDQFPAANPVAGHQQPACLRPEDEVGGIAGEEGASMDGEPLRTPCFGALQNELVETARNPWGCRATWTVEGGVDEVAAALLSDYQSTGSFELFHGDFLDLFGAVWGCVVVGDAGMVELAVIDGRQGGVLGDGQDAQATSCALTLVWLNDDGS